MIKIKFKKCCEDCIHLKLDTNDITLYSDLIPAMRGITIGCEHEPVCKEYIEEESHHDSKNRE